MEQSGQEKSPTIPRNPETPIKFRKCSTPIIPSGKSVAAKSPRAAA